MGYIDKELELALAADVFNSPASGSTKYIGADVGNQVDQLKAGDDLNGQLYVFVRVATAFAGAGNVTIAIVTDSELPIDGSSTVLHTFPTEAYTAFTANRLLKVKLPLGLNRYVGASVASSGTTTAGALDIWIGPSLDTNDLQS